MTNRPSICWKCIHREDCREFSKNPDAFVMECARFYMKDADRKIMEILYERFMEERRE